MALFFDFGSVATLTGGGHDVNVSPACAKALGTLLRNS